MVDIPVLIMLAARGFATFSGTNFPTSFAKIPARKLITRWRPITDSAIFITGFKAIMATGKKRSMAGAGLSPSCKFFNSLIVQNNIVATKAILFERVKQAYTAANSEKTSSLETSTLRSDE